MSLLFQESTYIAGGGDTSNMDKSSRTGNGGVTGQGIEHMLRQTDAEAFPRAAFRTLIGEFEKRDAEIFSWCIY